MKVFVQIFLCVILLMNFSFSQEKSSSALNFVPNQGQISNFNNQPRTDVLFSSQVMGTNIFLRKNGISYLQSNFEEVDNAIRKKIKKYENEDNPGSLEFGLKLREQAEFSYHQIDVDFLNCNSNLNTVKSKKTQDFLNFYTAASPDGITNVSLFNLIQYKNVYNGIGIDFYGNDKGFEYDFKISPNADPNQIKLFYKGSESIELTNGGNLKIKTSLNDIVESIPEAYQIIDTEKVLIEVSYNLTKLPHNAGSIISFNIENYDSSYELIIDPWVTYYGGGNFDRGNDLYNDNLGDLYVGGYTASSTSIATAGSFKISLTIGTGFSSYDGFLTKFSPAGNRLWATYYGGSSTDYLQAVTVDKNNNVYITGYSASDTGIATPGSFKDTLTTTGSTTTSYDAFLVKFSPTGLRLWGTYFGGNDYEFGSDVAVDTSNNVYITGRTASPNNIATAGAYKTTLTIGAGGTGTDSYVAKFSPLGIRLWSTYHGGEQFDYTESITTDSKNNVFICGNTSSTIGIGTIGTHQPTITLSSFGNGNDAFLIKFNSGGSKIWGTYFGGDNYETGKSVAIDSNDHIYLAGRSGSSTLISSAGSFQTTLGGIGDAYLAKFNQAGTRLWSSYYGGTLFDYAYSVSVNEITNNVIISGDTYSSDLPVSPCALQTSLIGTENGFVGQFNDDGTIYCSSYFGNMHEEDNKLTTFGCYIYLTGYSPGGVVTTPGAHQTTIGGSIDAYIAQLFTNTCGISTPLKTINLTKNNNSVPCKPCNGDATVSISSTCLTDSLYTYTWSDGTVVSNSLDTFNINSNLCAGNYWVEISIVNSCYTTRDTVFFTITDTNAVVIDFTADSVCIGLFTSFNNTTINEPVGTIYGWDFGDGNNSLLNNPTHKYGSSGNYLVTYIQQYGPGCFDTISKTITVYEKPKSDFSITLDETEYFSNNLDSICAFLYDPIDFNDYSTITTGSIDNYKWTLGSEGVNLNQNISYGFQGIKTHIVSLEVTSNFGCKDTSYTIIKVCDDFNFFMPNSFTPNGDGKNDVFTHDGFGIDIEKYEFSIYNRWGELLFITTTFEPWDGTYLGEAVKDDIYIWKIRYKNLNGNDIYQKMGHVTLTRPE